MVNGLRILAGLLGLLLSNKKSLLTVILGLVIPYYYFHNAVRNYKD